MAAQKKLMTKGQIASYFAGKFDISKKAAACMIDEYAALAIAETKKKGAFVLPGIGKSVLVKKKSPYRPEPRHRGGYQDSGQDGCEGQAFQNFQGGDCATQEIATIRPSKINNISHPVAKT